jgi:hypothetical protein
MTGTVKFNNIENVFGRDVIGSDFVIGDERWGGAWGLRADFIAKTACSILWIPAADILVSVHSVLSPHVMQSRQH